MVLILLDYDKAEIARFGIGDSVQSLILKIQATDVETIVAGDIDRKHQKVLWEKQFNATDVMPSEFGKKK